MLIRYLDYLNNNNDRILSTALSLVVLCLLFVNLSDGVTSFIYIKSYHVSIISKFFLGTVFLLAIPILILKADKFFALTIAISLAVITISLYVFPENNKYFIPTTISFLSICMTTMLYIRCIDDYSVLLNYWLKTSHFIAYFLLFFWLSILISGHLKEFNNGIYSMGLSYACLLPCIICLNDFIRTNSKTSGLAFIIFMDTIILFGARGPILSILTFILIMILKENYKNILKTMMAFLYILILLFTKFNFIIFVPYVLYKTASEHLATKGDLIAPQKKTTHAEPRSGTNNSLSTESNNPILENRSRTSEFFSSGNFANLTRRDVYYKAVVSEIIKKPFTIRGINAEYNIVDGYAHNIFLELIYQFGVILSSPLILSIVYYSYKTVKLNRRIIPNDIVVILFCVALPPLMVSGSLWKSMYFWTWISLILKFDKTQSNLQEHSLIGLNKHIFKKL